MAMDRLLESRYLKNSNNAFFIPITEIAFCLKVNIRFNCHVAITAIEKLIIRPLNNPASAYLTANSSTPASMTKPTVPAMINQNI